MNALSSALLTAAIVAYVAITVWVLADPASLAKIMGL